MNLIFKSDTKYRKQFFTGVSFSHPAKMMLPLELWLIENYTKPGDLILDPMAGSGTVLVACSMGRNVICVELEAKFIEIIKGNWQKIQERGPMLGCTMGNATILQGDARNLEGLLVVDSIISSPPYAQEVIGGPGGIDWTKGTRGKAEGNKPRDRSKEPAFGKLAGMGKDWGYSVDPSNIGNLPYGKIDQIITSPPYASEQVDNRKTLNDTHLSHKGFGCAFRENYDKNSIANLKYGSIGNMYNDSYLSAMLQVYQQCFAVLKAGGIMCLVTKNYIRNKQIIRLDEDTIKLCETAGFTFKERHQRKLTSQSFWRTIYAQKYPDAPAIEHEDILVFSKVEPTEKMM